MSNKKTEEVIEPKETNNQKNEEKNKKGINPVIFIIAIILCVGISSCAAWFIGNKMGEESKECKETECKKDDNKDNTNKKDDKNQTNDTNKDNDKKIITLPEAKKIDLSLKNENEMKELAESVIYSDIDTFKFEWIAKKLVYQFGKEDYSDDIYGSVLTLKMTKEYFNEKVMEVFSEKVDFDKVSRMQQSANIICDIDGDNVLIRSGELGVGHATGPQSFYLEEATKQATGKYIVSSIYVSYLKENNMIVYPVFGSFVEQNDVESKKVTPLKTLNNTDYITYEKAIEGIDASKISKYEVTFDNNKFVSSKKIQ